MMTSSSDMTGATQFFDRADVTEKVQALFDEDLAELGFVMNASRLWAYQPEAHGHVVQPDEPGRLGAAL